MVDNRYATLRVGALWLSLHGQNAGGWRVIAEERRVYDDGRIFEEYQ